VAAVIPAAICFLIGSPPYNALIVGIVIFFTTAYGMAINDYFDHEKDLLSPKNHVIAAGRLSRNQVLVISICLLLISIFFTFYLFPFQQLLNSTIILILSAYSYINNKFGILANILVAMCVAASILMTQQELEISIVSLTSLCAFFIIFSREIILDIHDYDADCAVGKTSFPITLNIDNSFIISAVFSSVSLVAAIIIGMHFTKWHYILVMIIAHFSFLSCLFNYKNNKDEKTFDAFASYSRISCLLLIPALVI
jgi:4-hydroxybenzoate polyprenyltransferase